MARYVSVGRILKRDWPSFGLAIFICCCWLVALGIYLVVAFRFPEDHDGWMLAHIFGVVFLVATVACVAVILRRIQIIRQVFGRGEMVRGHVLSIATNSEDISYAVVAYEYQGREYRIKNVTEGSSQEVTPGEEIDIVVDPRKPDRAFIAKMFLS